MIMEHNEHQLNVNVINTQRGTGSFYKLSSGKTMTPSTNYPLPSGFQAISQTSIQLLHRKHSQSQGRGYKTEE